MLDLVGNPEARFSHLHQDDSLSSIAHLRDKRRFLENKDKRNITRKPAVVYRLKTKRTDKLTSDRDVKPNMYLMDQKYFVRKFNDG